MGSRVLEASDTRVAIADPSPRELKRTGQTPRRRHGVPWLVFAVLLGALYARYKALDVDSLRDLFAGIDPVALVPAALILLVAVTLGVWWFYLPSLVVVDDFGVRSYRMLGAVRLRASQHPWDKVLVLRLDDDAIVIKVAYSAQEQLFLIGPALTSEERARAFEAIRAIASQAGCGFLVGAHA